MLPVKTHENGVARALVVTCPLVPYQSAGMFYRQRDIKPGTQKRLGERIARYHAVCRLPERITSHGL